jgi:subtilisin family serine protease
MSPFVVRTRLAVAALAALGLAGGCTPLAARRARAEPGTVASAGRSVAMAPALTESRTLSLALDRIDQVDLPLDHTYRHFGTGRSVAVYVFDGGILEWHPELAGRVRRGFDAFPGEERLCNAHGTAVAGAIAGRTLGVAPQAQIVDVKMVECRRLRGSIDAIVRGADWVIADHARHPGQRAVANWSFIADTAADVPALDAAVGRLRAAGIPVVVSAGNVELDACQISPANAPGTIVVGASRVKRLTESSGTLAGTLTDARAPHTAYGACIDVFAPGDSVLLPGIDAIGDPISQLWTGTSMSAGYVSGAVALFLEANPTATVDQVREHIETASQLTAVDAKSPRAGMLYVGTGTDGRSLRSLGGR